MSLFLGHLYTALREAGASEPTARAAAEDMVRHQWRKDARREFALVKALTIVVAAAVAAPLFA